MTTPIPLSRYRKIGIIAHIDHGKTTLTDFMRFLAGLGHKVGSVHEGTSFMDWMAQEKERGITITAAALRMLWLEYLLTIIDTPGHIDFNVEVERSLRVLDGAIVVIDAVSGPAVQTEKVNRQAADRNIPVIVFVNKMDRTGADFPRAVEKIHDELELNPAVLTLPIGNEEGFKGVVLVLENKAIVWDENDANGRTMIECAIPEDMASEVEAQRKTLIESIVVAAEDDKLMEDYLEEKEIEVERLRDALRKATIARKLTPVMCGSAYKKKGVQPLLDAICDYLPSPLDVPAVVGEHDEQQVVRKADASEPLAALVFKLGKDPEFQQQQLTYVCVFSGRLENGKTVLNSSTGETVRVGRLGVMEGPTKKPVDVLGPGDIGVIQGAVAGSGDTLCAINAPVVLERIHVAEAVVTLSIKPKKSSDSEKMGKELARLAENDPSLRVEKDEETSEIKIAGPGELHLEIVVDELRRAGVEVEVGEPSVKYRETIEREAEIDYTHKKQSGGTGQFARVKFRVSPNPGAGFAFTSSISGGAIDKEHVVGTEKGIKKALEKGPQGEFPVVDVAVDLYDGAKHEVDSSQMAFEIAGAAAFREVMLKAKPILLEPWGLLEVVVLNPEEHLGDVIGEINARKGLVMDNQPRGKARTVKAKLPISKSMGLANKMRSLCGGRVEFSLVPDNYARVRDDEASKVLAQRAAAKGKAA